MSIQIMTLPSFHRQFLPHDLQRHLADAYSDADASAGLVGNDLWYTEDPATVPTVTPAITSTRTYEDILGNTSTTTTSNDKLVSLLAPLENSAIAAAQKALGLHVAKQNLGQFLGGLPSWAVPAACAAVLYLIVRK